MDAKQLAGKTEEARPPVPQMEEKSWQDIENWEELPVREKL